MSGAQPQSGWKIIRWQVLIVVITIAAIYPVFDLVTAYSGLAGGLISIAANAFFAIRLFDDKGGWQKDQLTATVYRGVIGKLFLTIALFFLAMALVDPLNVTALFAVFLWIQVSPALIAGILKI